MIEEPEMTAEDELRAQAKLDIETAPAPVPGAEDLPEDVPSERIPEDDGSTQPHEGEPE